MNEPYQHLHQKLAIGDAINELVSTYSRTSLRPITHHHEELDQPNNIGRAYCRLTVNSL